MNIIFDLDGVLIDCEHRIHHIRKQPKDWDKFFSTEETSKDTVIQTGAYLLKLFREEWFNQITLVTGRPERTRDDTLQFLKAHDIWCCEELLLMRADGDHRPASQVKKDIVSNLRAIEGCSIDLAIDDDARICKMYRELGIPTMLFMSDHSTLWKFD